MNRFIRIAAIAVGAIIGLAALALTALNLYVQSQGTQATIEQELSQRLGTAIRIRAVSVTPWGGLMLSGITVPQPPPNESSSDFLSAQSFQFRVGLMSLISRQLVIKKVTLVSPKVVWPQDADGKWRLPGANPESRAKVAPAESVPAGAAQTGAAPLPSASATAPIAPPSLPDSDSVAASPSAPPKRPGALLPDVRRVSLTDGRFRFLDHAGNMVSMFQDVEFSASMRDLSAIRGTATVAKVSVRDRFFVEGLHSPVRYEPGKLDLPRISARAAGGDLTGSFNMQTQDANTPFSVTMRFRNLEADQVVMDAGGGRGVVQGKLDGNLEVRGKTSDGSALAGAGEIVLRDGQLQQYSLLVALGQVLQIEELTQLQLQEARAKYHITPGLITVDELTLRSPNLRLAAKGNIQFNGKLKLDAQLAINEKIRGQLFKAIRKNFQPTSETGYSAVDFEIGGTLERPRTNLVDRVVGQDIKDIVSGLFGGGKKSDKKKKRGDPEASPGPMEEMTPVPPPPAAASASPAP